MIAQPVLVVLLKGYPRLSETFVAQEIRSLEAAGFRLRIVSMRQPTDKAVHPVHREIKAPVVYLPEYLHDAPLRVLRGLLAARRLPGFRSAFKLFLKDLGQDVSRNRIRRFGQAAVMAAEQQSGDAHIHAHFIHTPASVARYASLMTGLPWSCSAHAKDIWTSGEAELADKLAAAAFTVTCTEAGLQRLNALAPRKKPAHLVYHGIDLARFRPLSAPLAERNGTNPEKPVRFLTVARAVEKKGLDTLIDGLARLPASLCWTWTHIGGGSLSEKLSQQAKDRGLAARCRFLGARAQEEVIAAYGDSDVFVLPCRIAADGDRDGLPNVLMEAASHGLALVSTPVSGVTELIEDGITGCIIPPDDPAALAETMGRLIAEPLLRHRLGRAASRKVSAEFDHDKAILGLIGLFPANLHAFANAAAEPARDFAAE
jgi:glycosyltransferase involved in cell wall biosynthesis